MGGAGATDVGQSAQSFKDPIPIPNMLMGAVVLLRPVPRQVLLRWMLESDAVANCSLAEGMPNALLEAAALGVPVIARNIPGNVRVVRHEVTGYLFDRPDEFVERFLGLDPAADGAWCDDACAGCSLDSLPYDHGASGTSSAAAVRGAMGKHAMEMISSDFSCESEEASWHGLLREVMGTE